MALADLEIAKRTMVAGFAVVVALAGCGGSSKPSPTSVAQAAGASTCDDSGFYIQSKLTGQKLAIFDCRFADKLPKCVTYSGRIASDATEEVRLLFSTSINSKGPRCLDWIDQAKARRARLAAQKAAARQLARRRAYTAALNQDQKAAWHDGYTPDWQGVGSYELPNVYFKWVAADSITCADYATNGCWNVLIVTRNGCPTGVNVEVDETLSGTQIGTVYGTTGSLQPQTPAKIEIDADQSQSLQGRIGSLTCD